MRLTRLPKALQELFKRAGMIQSRLNWEFTGVAVLLFVLILNNGLDQQTILGGKDDERQFNFTLISRGLLSSIVLNNNLIVQTEDDFQEAGGWTTFDIPLNSIQGNSLLSFNSPSTRPFTNGQRTEITIYVVKSGDVPSLIAAEFNININTLLWANDLVEGEIIRPGQELKILPIDGVTHIVKTGETVSALAKTYKAEALKIIDFNRLSQDGSLITGQTIIIPDGEKPFRRFVSNKNNLVGYFKMPASGRNWGRLHPTNAVDIANICGTPVYAAASGFVSRADDRGWNGGYGIYVKIDHPNGTSTLYAHLMKVLISAGSQVDSGEVIGLIGTTGRSTGCHVHFEVYGARNPFIR